MSLSNINNPLSIPDKSGIQLDYQNTENSTKKNISLIKKGIWVYFLLLIFEGALRKWFLPGLSNPLLIVRDPIALWLLIVAWKHGLMPTSFYLAGMIITGILSFFSAILLGHGSFLVALYGARILLLHFPLIFLIGQIFTRDDVIKMGKIIVWLSIPMTALIVLQFYSPQSAWVNHGLGGDLAGAGFDGAGGYFRPPATFSFITGTNLFYGLVASFIFYFWFDSNGLNRLVLIIATLCLIISVPVSISRTLFFHVAFSFMFSLIANLQKPKFLIKTLFACAGGLIVLSQLSFFETASEAFLTRFEGATEYEGGIKGTLGNRYLGGMIGAITGSSDLPFFGYGLGMGTNVGGLLLTGTAGFTIAEDEWPRVIGELGLIMGFAVILIRLGLCIKIAIDSFLRLRYGDVLPWMLSSFGLLTIPQGQWAQPTTLGFGVLIGGLMLASFKKTNT